MTAAVITTRGLTKRFGERLAVDGVDFSVDYGVAGVTALVYRTALRVIGLVLLMVRDVTA